MNNRTTNSTKFYNAMEYATYALFLIGWAICVVSIFI